MIRVDTFSTPCHPEASFNLVLKFTSPAEQVKPFETAQRWSGQVISNVYYIHCGHCSILHEGQTKHQPIRLPSLCLVVGGHQKFTLTLQGITAVNPGLTGLVPVALNVSPAAVKVAFMRRYTQSELTDPKKWRVT